MTRTKIEQALIKFTAGAVVINRSAIGAAFGWGPHRVQEFCSGLEPICPGKRTKSYLIVDVAAKAAELTNGGGA